MKTASYKALLFYGPGDLRLENVPFPELAPGEALVRVEAATTCGTDLKTFQRGHPVIIKQIPSPFGHEMAGTVERLGPDASGFMPGDRVVVSNSGPCLECFYCRKNEHNLCENILFINGAFAEYVRVPAQIVRSNLHRIPDGVPFEVAALTEPLACVVHACEHMAIRAGETVALVGTGPMAFLFVQTLRALGAQAIVIGRNPKRLAMLVDAGADAAVNSDDGDSVAAVRQLTEGHGADVAIEAVGQPATWELAVRLARKGGRVCLYGGCAKGTAFNLDTYRLHYDEISVSGVFHHTPAALAKALALLGSGKIRTDLLLGEKRRLEDVPRIFAGHDPAKPLKFLIQPR